MIVLNSPTPDSQNVSGILVEEYVIVQKAAALTGYNVQYLRRMLRAGRLKSAKVGQVWLIQLESLAVYLNQAIYTTDQRWGPKLVPTTHLFTFVNTECLQTYTADEKEDNHEYHRS